MKIEKESGRKFWDSHAAKYDSHINKGARENYQLMFQFLKDDSQNAKSILEVATGIGLISFEIYDAEKQMIACDLSPEMIKIAKQKAFTLNKRNIKFEVGDIYELNYQEGSFDLIIASNILHLLVQPELAINELKRLLSKNGILILPTYLHGHNLLSHLISRITSLSGFKVGSRWNKKSFESFLHMQKLEIIKSIKLKSIMPMQYVVCEKIN